MATAYDLFAAGSVLLWPAVAVVATRIGARSAGWGPFARAFHAGVDHLAFQLVRSQGVESASQVVSTGYGAFHVFSALNPAIVAGWVVLALGAWRTRVLGPVRAIALGLAAALPLGVLKGDDAPVAGRPGGTVCRPGAVGLRFAVPGAPPQPSGCCAGCPCPW